MTLKAVGRRRQPQSRKDDKAQIDARRQVFADFAAAAGAYGKEYPLDAEPSPRDLIVEPCQWPRPLLPERRLREVEQMLSLATPSQACRARLYRILEIAVHDERINPRQREAAKSVDAHTTRFRQHMEDIDKVATKLHRLLTDRTDGLWARDVATGLDTAFPYPRTDDHPVIAFAGSVAAVAAAARLSARLNRRPRGQPKNYFGASVVGQLADLYERATGKRAGRSTSSNLLWGDNGAPDGPFFRLVHYMYEWIGPPYSTKTENAVAADIRRYAPMSTRRVERWEPWILATIETDRLQK